MERVSFKVEGMSCASCASSVETILTNIEGVKSAVVNLATETVTVEFDSRRVDYTIMANALKPAGYLLKEDLTLLIEEEELQFKQHLRRSRVNVWGAFLVAVPIFIMSMFFHHHNDLIIIQAILTLAVIYFGRNIYRVGFKRLFHGGSSMETLVAIGASAAIFFSYLQLIFWSYLQEQGFELQLYFESAAVITAFVLLGKYLEELSKRNTTTSLKKLIGLQAKDAVRITDSGEELVPIQKISVGDKLKVVPGSKIPLDGVVVEGSAYIDESMITGESMPVEKKTGEKVIGGTILLTGFMVVEVTSIGKDTLLSRIIDEVRNAQTTKAPIQRLADKVASIFVPIVITIAIVSMVSWIVFGENQWYRAFNAFFTVLVIACPCALGLATPTALVVAIGRLAEKGIYVKEAAAIEKAEKIDVLAIDKTGTITEGRPAVIDKWFVENIQSDSVRAIAAIESLSEHPIARAVVDHLGNFDSSIVVEQFENKSGLGVKAIVNGNRYVIGNKELIKQYDLQIPAYVHEKTHEWEQKNSTVIYCVENDIIIALFAIADKIKENAIQVITDLKSENIEIHLLSGDNIHVVNHIAHVSGISQYSGNMLPNHKLTYIKKLQQKGKIVGMAGDGINDAPALTQADVSFAMANGTDIAINSSSIAVLHGDLTKISETIQFSKKTMRVIRQNLFWAFFYNILAIPLATGIFYPIWQIEINPMIAGIAMSLSSVTVVTNSLRLKYL